MVAGDYFRTASPRLENGFVGPLPKHHRRLAAVSSPAAPGVPTAFCGLQPNQRPLRVRKGQASAEDSRAPAGPVYGFPQSRPRRLTPAGFYFTPPGAGALGGTSSFRQALLEPLLMEGNMRRFLIAALFAIVPIIGPANAADGCGPGCHSTSSGACVVDGWGTGAPVWNECPAGARARPPCGYGYAWRQSMRACFPRVGPNG
jgi:hypothetical protein